MTAIARLPERVAAFLICAAIPLAITPALRASSPALGRSPLSALQRAGTNTNPTALTEMDFTKRINDYAQLHKKLESSMPKLPKDATPIQIDQNQRALEQLLVQARPNAKQGDFFTPGMEALVRQMLADVFKGVRGQQARKQVNDEPHPVRPQINKRYPDIVPLSTMPPRVLKELPRLPDEMEYRFINDDLILMDVHAHIILDYILDAMPAPKPAPKPASRPASKPAPKPAPKR